MYDEEIIYYLQNNQLKEATTPLLKYLEKNPTDLRVYCDLSYVYLNRGIYDNAIEYAKKGIYIFKQLDNVNNIFLIILYINIAQSYKKRAETYEKNLKKPEKERFSNQLLNLSIKNNYIKSKEYIDECFKYINEYDQFYGQIKELDNLVTQKLNNIL